MRQQSAVTTSELQSDEEALEIYLFNFRMHRELIRHSSNETSGGRGCLARTYSNANSSAVLVACLACALANESAEQCTDDDNDDDGDAMERSRTHVQWWISIAMQLSESNRLLLLFSWSIAQLAITISWWYLIESMDSNAKVLLRPGS